MKAIVNEEVGIANECDRCDRNDRPCRGGAVIERCYIVSDGCDRGDAVLEWLSCGRVFMVIGKDRELLKTL